MIYYNRMLVKFTSRWARNASPEGHTGVLIIKGTVGRRTSLSFLRKHHASIISSSSRLGREVSCPCLVKLGPQIIVFYVCGEHVLRIIKPLSSLDRMLVSYHHCFIFWEHVLWFLCMVLLLSKLAWFCGSADPLS